jgi:hypothetical protein
MSELRSVIDVLPLLQVADNAMPVEQCEGFGPMADMKAFDTKAGATGLAKVSL